MNFQNKSLVSSILALVLATYPLVACQSRSSRASANSGPFQCIAATIMVAGKPTTTVVEWNTNTGATRILDSMVVTAKATGAQNVVIGWIPLGDLQGTIQEIVNRNQALQQEASSGSSNVLPASAQQNSGVVVPAQSSKAKNVNGR